MGLPLWQKSKRNTRFFHANYKKNCFVKSFFHEWPFKPISSFSHWITCHYCIISNAGISYCTQFYCITTYSLKKRKILQARSHMLIKCFSKTIITYFIFFMELPSLGFNFIYHLYFILMLLKRKFVFGLNSFWLIIEY